MTLEELQHLIREARETRRVELKAPMDWDDQHTQAKIVKAALAFANTEGGGVLLLGFEEDAPDQFTPVGLSVQQLSGFATDSVQTYINARVAPPISLFVQRVAVDGKEFIAIVVHEFSDYPVLCTKAVQPEGAREPVVHKGRMYCRSRRMNETTEVQAADDLREIVRLASLKELRRYLELRSVEPEAGPSDAERFKGELGTWER